MSEPGVNSRPPTPPEKFLTLAQDLGIEFDAGDIDRLARYLALLLDANTRFNLTAINDPDEAWTRHILDSLTLVPFIVEANANAVIDVGSGGGVPGIPLAIVFPRARFVLLESTGKKAAFLREVTTALHLENVEVVNERAETAGQDRDRFRDKFDVVVARAVGPLPVLLELTVPLARVGGTILAMKGAKAPQEVADAKAALHRLHAVVVGIHAAPTGNVVVIEKSRPTPHIYPRRPGEPKKSPLK